MKKPKQKSSKADKAPQINQVSSGRRYFAAESKKVGLSGQKKRKKSLLILSVFSLVFLAVLITLTLLKKSAAVSKFMTTTVSRGLITATGKVSALVPFSIYELFLLLVAITLVVCFFAIIINLFKKRFAKSLQILLSLVLIGLICGNIYFLSAGFAYNRYDQYFPTASPTLNKEQMVEVAEYFIDDLNRVAHQQKRDDDGNIIMPYSLSQLSKKLQKEYKRLDSYDMNTFTARCKPLLSSKILKRLPLGGVFFAPLGEANINAAMPAIELPFTMAHEMAHSKGVMREDETNNVALYITLTSDDPYIRYSAYKSRIFTLLDAVYAWESRQSFDVVGEEQERPQSEHQRLINKIDALFWQDRDRAAKYWQESYKISEIIGDVLNNINEIYLKIMGQKEGTQAYLPPPTNVIEQPIKNPDGTPATDPDGNPKTIYVPEYNIVQKIFFRAYLEDGNQFPSD